MARFTEQIWEDFSRKVKDNLDHATAIELLEDLAVKRADMEQFEYVVDNLLNTVGDLMEVYHGGSLGLPDRRVRDEELMTELDKAVAIVKSVKSWRNKTMTKQ